MEFSDERFQKMLRGRTAVAVVDFPGMQDAKVGVRVLLDRELDDCRAAAAQCVEAAARRVGISPEHLSAIDPEMFDAEVTRQIIGRAYVVAGSGGDGKDPKPFFPGSQTVRQLDSATVRALMDAYLEHQDQVSPLMFMSDAEVAQLVAELGKEQAPLLWSALGPDTQRRFALTMAAKLASSQPSKSSGG